MPARARMRRATTQAETGVQARARTAAEEAGNSGGSGDSGLRWEGECEVTKWTIPSQG